MEINDLPVNAQQLLRMAGIKPKYTSPDDGNESPVLFKPAPVLRKAPAPKLTKLSEHGATKPS